MAFRGRDTVLTRPARGTSIAGKCDRVHRIDNALQGEQVNRRLGDIELHGYFFEREALFANP